MTTAEHTERRQLIADAVLRRKEDRDSEVSEDIILAEIRENDLGAFHVQDGAYDSDEN